MKEVLTLAYLRKDMTPFFALSRSSSINLDLQDLIP